MSQFVVALILAIPASSAEGDVDVRPAPNEAHLRLDGERVVAPRAQRPPNTRIRGPQSPSGVPGAPPPGAGVPSGEPRDTYCEMDSLGIQCYYVDAEETDEDESEEGRRPTDGDVLRATREIGLPSLQVRIQPGEKTLVNVATIFYAEPEPFERSVTLLGFEVDIVAAPISYRWVHGDGTAATTSTPGKPYPGKDVTHRYRVPADDVQARVDVTYQVKYRVDGGAWQTIGQTLLASGPAAELDVKEAAPVMTTPRV